jgi:Legionella pneumophila major outer membrane protein precursor
MLNSIYCESISKFNVPLKKLSVGLTVLLAGIVTPTFAAYPIRSPHANLPPERNFYFSFTALRLKSSLLGSDFALTFPSQSFADGVYHDNNFDEKWGYRASIGSPLWQPGSNVMLTYTYFRDEARNHAIPGAHGQLLPTLTSIGSVTETTTPIYVIDVTLAPDTALVPPDQLPALIIPATNISTTLSVTSATARSRLIQNAFDLDFGQWINVCNFGLRLFGGLRYAHLEHKSETYYTAAGTSSTTLTGQTQFIGEDNLLLAASNVGASIAADLAAARTDNIRSIQAEENMFDAASDVDLSVIVDLAASLRDNIHQESDFNGVGPRFGIAAHYEFGSSGFSLVGNAATALIVGRIKNKLTEQKSLDATETIAATSYTVTTVPGFGTLVISPVTFDVAAGDVTNVPTVNTINRIRDNNLRVVPNVDASLGVSYTYTFSNCSHSALTLEAGYAVIHYWNATDFLSAVDITQPELRTREALDVSFEGPYVGIQLRI